MAGNLELGLQPVRGLLERDLEPVLEVFAAPRARAAPAAAAEESLEEIPMMVPEAGGAGPAPGPGRCRSVVVRARSGSESTAYASLMP